MRSLCRVFGSFALALALVAASGGCGPKDMKKLEVPAAGIRLAYDLAPGTALDGHLRIGNTLQIPSVGSLNRSLECNVRMVVLGDDRQRGGARLQATFSQIDIKWSLPPAAGISTAEFVRTATNQLQGMKVTFTALPSGKIIYMPVPPPGLPVELSVFLDQVLRGLEDAFLVVPKHAVKDGERWTENERRGRKGKLGRYVEGKVETLVEGLFRDAGRGEDVVRLAIVHERKETVTTQDGARDNESTGKSTVLFSTGGYLAKLDGESRDYDPVRGMNFRKIEVTWKPAARAPVAGGEPEPTTDPCHPDYVGEAQCEGADAQSITDPCDPDYVGAEDCVAPLPAEAGPTPSPAPVAPPS